MGELISALSTQGFLFTLSCPWAMLSLSSFALSLGEAADKNLMAVVLLLENEWRRRWELLGEQSS